MGEAAPAQPAVGGFVSMLGVGMLGSMPGRASGPLAASRGSAVPQLHSAIVERLRARIELCRRHHSTCESRYQRGQAETSDREHENTLHLLNLVHQSAGNRKIRGSRSVGQQSSGTDFNRLNSEQRTQNSETEPKAVSRNLVHGSLRRKIEGHPSGLKKNGITCGSSSSNSGGDFKRLRVDPAAASLQAGPSRLHNNHPAGPGSMGHHHHHHNHHHNNHHHHPLHPLMSHTLGSDLFNITLRDMKKEPVEMQTCGGHVSSADAVGMMGFDFKDEGGGGGGGGQIDPDLQELFDELTKSVPSLNDLELEKILKQDDTFNLGELGRPSSAGSTNNACHLLLDRPIKTEYSPDYGQVSKGSSSSQLRPASAGPSFSMDGPVQANHGQSSQGSAGLSRSVSGWPELSHAEQLKQMAANQQQPSVLLHHPQQNHQNQNHQVTSWPPLGLGNNSHSAGGGFPGENKLPGVGTGCSQPLAIKQNKGRSNCSFKRNGFNNNSNYTDHKVLNSKPMLQFTPKALGANRHQVPLMTLPQGKANSQQQQQQEHQAGGPQNKTSQHQNQSHGGLHFPNQQVGPMAGSQCLLPKGLTQRPGVNHPGPGMHNKDKAGGAQDQFSHHLSRPPPDYEQARIAVGGQNSGIYAGLASSQTVVKRSPERSDIQTLPCPPLSNSQAPKLAPASSDTFPCRPDPHQGSCVQPCVGGPQLREQQQQQQHHYNNNGTNDSRMGGLHPNKLPPFQTTNGGQTFPTNMQPRARTGVPPQHRLMGPAGLRGSPGGGGGSMESGGGLNWVQGHKQPGGGVDLKRAPGSVGSPSSQPELGVHHHRFQQTPSSIGPPNQVAPHGHGGMPPINSGNMRGSTTSRACPPHNSQPRMSAPPPSNTMNSGSGPESVCSGSPFPPPPNQNLRAYQQQTNSSNSRPGHGQHTFDFLPEGDNTVPGVNTDSDFIDSLLKSGTGNDDWMKDINLEEILGGSS